MFNPPKPKTAAGIRFTKRLCGAVEWQKDNFIGLKVGQVGGVSMLNPSSMKLQDWTYSAALQS